MPLEVSARPNKHWPFVVGASIVCLFAFLSFVNQKHATSSGDNIHKFSNGGTYRDGTKSIKYNTNNHRAYGGNNLLSGSSVWVWVIVIVLVGVLFRSFSSSKNFVTCPTGSCNGQCCKSRKD